MQRADVNLWEAYRAVARRWSTVLPFAWGYKLLYALLLAPVLSWGLQQMLLRYGRASVGNFEVAKFALSPSGLATVVLGGSLLLALHYFEIAGLQLLLADRTLDWSQGWRGAVRHAHRLVLVGLRQLLACLVIAGPVLAGVGLAFWLFWSRHDLNSLTVLRPRDFWLGLAMAVPFVLTGAAYAAAWLLRWSLAVPVLLFESPIGPFAALERSRELTRGWLPRMALTLGGLLAAHLALTAVTLAGLGELSEWVLARVPDRLSLTLTATAGLLLLHAGLLALLSALGTTLFAAVSLQMYRQRAGVEWPAREDPRRRRLSFRWLVVLGLAGLMLAGLYGSRELVRAARLDDNIELTAHRAGATKAPENTIAALTQAIADRAEWAEIDVQRTADGELVVLHDIDVARIGGGQRRVADCTLAEIQRFDVGSAFGPPGFAGERAPSLAQLLGATQGRIRLNIELKPHGRADEEPLVEGVVALLRDRNLLARSRICSQSYQAIQHARKLAPEVEIGFIAANALGDLSKLRVNYLMVARELATRELVERARLRQIEVHPWTINDPKWVAPLLDAGCANIITDDPARLRARLEEIRQLGTVDRLLLRAREVLRD